MNPEPVTHAVWSQLPDVSGIPSAWMGQDGNREGETRWNSKKKTEASFWVPDPTNLDRGFNTVACSVLPGLLSSSFSHLRNHREEASQPEKLPQ